MSLSEDKDSSRSPGDNSGGGGEDEEVPVDMDEFEASGLLDAEDADNVIQPGSLGAGTNKGPDGSSEIMQTRTYDLHITYDKFYQTPRLFLFGYDEVSSTTCFII